MKKLSITKYLLLTLMVFSVFLSCKKDKCGSTEQLTESYDFWFVLSIYEDNPTPNNCEAVSEAAKNYYKQFKNCPEQTQGEKAIVEEWMNRNCGSGGSGGGNGNVVFWTASDLGQITVSINGQTKTITQYYSTSSPSCGSTGCATFNLPAGTYSFTASSYKGNWSGSVTVNSGGCSSRQLTGTSGSNNGKVAFWSSTNQGSISVTINGSTKYISSYYSSGGVNCSSSGCAIFDLAPGSYSYTAYSNSTNWNGTVTISANGCATMQLKPNNGGGSTGNLIVWIQSDLGHGNITVKVSGYSSVISSYYYSIPSCGSSGCANFTLPQGYYNVSASSSDGYTWSSSIQVNNGQCSRLQLY
ncbi:MAG: hypothetical protein R2801_00005 [Chitinophagales bacterium]